MTGSPVDILREGEVNKRYKVEKDLSIPSAHFSIPIAPNVLEAFGIDPIANQTDLGLARVDLTAGSYGGKWLVNAYKNPGTEEDDIYGAIWCEDGTTSEQTLPIAEEWIRATEGVEWVPGPVVQTTYPEEPKYIVQGMILVRTSDVLIQPHPPKKSFLVRVAGRVGLK